MHEGSISVNAAFWGPLVYIFSKNGIALYIGSAGDISRPLGHNHMYKDVCLDAGCELEIISCETREDAFVLERDLILKYQPLLNSRTPARKELGKEERRKVLKMLDTPGEQR